MWNIKLKSVHVKKELLFCCKLNLLSWNSTWNISLNLFYFALSFKDVTILLQNDACISSRKFKCCDGALLYVTVL